MPAEHAPANGEAALHVAAVCGRSAVVKSWAKSPLRLLTPRARGESVWAYTSTFGGGIVAGDQTRLELRVDAGATCFLSTQASTKVYRNPARLPCSHTLDAAVGPDALLILAPDPVQCFTESRYDQRQQFHLAPTASLLLVDWLSCGRTARGERWSFERYCSRIEINRGGRLLADALLLENRSAQVGGKSPTLAHDRFRVGRFNCLATVVLLGPRLGAYAQQLLARVGEQPIVPRSDVVVAASPLREGALLRLAGVSVEQIAHALTRHLSFVRDLLQDDPWSRKW